MCGLFGDMQVVGRDEDRTLKNDWALHDSAKQRSGNRDLTEGVKFKWNFQWGLGR